MAKSRAEKLAPIVAGLAVAIPSLVFRYPAMSDLPFHQGLVAALRHFDDPAWAPPGLYVHNFGHTNQLFYLVAWPLSYVFGVELACKLVVAATVLGVVVAAGRLAEHVGSSRWTALLLAPVAVGWLYYWGLIANLMGLASLLAMLPTLDRLAESPSPKRALVACLGCVLLYECHELTLVLYAGAALVFAAGHALRLRATLLRVSPFLVAAALSLVEYLRASSLFAHEAIRTSIEWSPISHKLRAIPETLFGAAPPVLLCSTAAVCAVGLALLLAPRLPTEGAPRHEPGGSGARALLHGYRFEALGLSCLALYFLLPANVPPTASLVYHRFLAPAYALLVVCAGRGAAARGVRPVTCLVLGAAPLAAVFTLLPVLAEVGDAARDVDALAEKMQPDTAVALLELGPESKDDLGPSIVSTMGARVLTARGGRLLLSFMMSPIAPVIYSPAYDWDEPVRRTLLDSYMFRPAHDLQRFRYVLLHSTSEPLETAAIAELSPEARLIGRAGDWSLLESNLPLVPLLSADVPLPSPHPESLRARFKKRSARAGESPMRP